MGGVPIHSWEETMLVTWRTELVSCHVAHLTAGNAIGNATATPPQRHRNATATPPQRHHNATSTPPDNATFPKNYFDLLPSLLLATFWNFSYKTWQKSGQKEMTSQVSLATAGPSSLSCLSLSSLSCLSLSCPVVAVVAAVGASSASLSSSR